MEKKNSSQSGVALLMALSILALLSILGIAFATNMRIMERTTCNFVYEMQARYLAEGGIDYAIAWLKDDARNNFVFSGVSADDMLDTAPLNLSQDFNLRVRVIDTARMININNADETLLQCLPGNIGQETAQDIIERRGTLPEGKYLTKKSICLSGVGQVTYENIENYITTDTYIDPNVQTDVADTFLSRSALNINTLVDNVDHETMIRQVLDAVPGFGTGTNSSNVTNVLNALRDNPDKPIESWQEFDSLIDGAAIAAGGGYSAEEIKGFVKDTFNPNRVKPGAGYPTEFCFHPGGTYELTSTGSIIKNNLPVASKTISATVKIFDLWNMTTKEQFIGDDANYNGVQDGGEGPNIPEYARVTWLDSCPVNIDECWQDSFVGPGKTVNNSLKIGYWDNFSENDAYSSEQWQAIPWTFHNPETNSDTEYTDDFTIEDGQLKTRNDINTSKGQYRDEYGHNEDPDGNPFRPDSYPKIDLGRVDPNDILHKRWRWFSFNLKCRMIDENGRPAGERRDNVPWHSIPKYWKETLGEMKLQMWQNVGKILFWRANQGSEHGEDSGENSIFITYIDSPRVPPDPIDSDDDGIIDYYDYGCCKIWRNAYEAEEPSSPLRHDGDIPGSRVGCSGHSNSSLLLSTMYNYTSGMDLSDNAIAANYSTPKDIHLTARTDAVAPRIAAKISNSNIIDANPANPYNKRGPGLITFFGECNLPWMEHIRVIPEDGYYTSYPIDFGNQPFEWGSAFWTQTKPDTVDEDEDESVNVSLEVAGSANISFNPIWLSNEEDLYNRVTHGDLGWDEVNGYTGPGTGLTIGSPYPKTAAGNRYLKIKILLETSDYNNADFIESYSETPVLEDIWITYLPKTKILYWREE